MLNKIKNFPPSLAALFMVVMFLLSILLGNARAISKHQKACDEAFLPIYETIQEACGEASNLLILAERYDAPSQNELKDAIENAKKAEEAEDAAEANGSMVASAKVVQEEIKGILAENDKNGDLKNLQSAMDDLQSQQNILKRLVSTYNESALAAQEVYQKLPTRFLLGGAPEVFE